MYVLTGLGQSLQYKVTGLSFIGGGGVYVDWLGTVTSIKSSWIVIYLWVNVLTGLGQSLQYKVTGLSFIGGGGGEGIR